MFAFVDIKEENGTSDLFPHDCMFQSNATICFILQMKIELFIFSLLDRALRWKIEILLESGFDLGRRGRTYRYLHHSQSQLKDKQFWFYHHNDQTNFSFEEAFTWMGDFQDERIVAKHAARIAQCFTSAEATIRVKINHFIFSFISIRY